MVSKRRAEIRSPKTDEKHKELFNFNAVRLLMDRGSRFESATTFTGRCDGEAGPDSDPFWAVGEFSVETRRHSDGGSSA